MESGNNNFLLQQFQSHNKNKSYNKDDLLSQAVIDLYMGLKQKLKQYSAGKINLNDSSGQFSKKSNNTIDDNSSQNEEEKKRLSQLGNMVIIDYIRSSMDILLNLKIENAIFENQQKNQYDTYINSSRGGHGAPNLDEPESQRSSDQSSMTQRDGPPKVYEELIQNLEADVRKHIRIEQQLKLHIESIESRLDELESENEKLLREQIEFDNAKSDMQYQSKKKVEGLEEDLRKLRQDLKDQESKHAIESRSIQERFQIEKEQLITEVAKLELEIKKQQQLQQLSSKSNNSTEVCSQCKALLSPTKGAQPFSQYNFQEESRSGNKNMNDLSLDTLEKKVSNGSNNSATNKQKMFFKRNNVMNCNCLCPQCQVVHQQENSQQQQQMHGSSATNYKAMQMQFLDKSMNPNNNFMIQQDQNEINKHQKDISKFMVSEKRQSASKKRQGNNSSNNYIQTGTPDKKNPQSVNTILNALNIQMNSTQSNKRKSNNQQILQTQCCCQQQNRGTNKLAASYITCQGDENPYLSSLQMHPQLLGKFAPDSNNTSKNQMLYDQSSNSSLNQGDNSMVILQNKKHMQRQTITAPPPQNIMQNCGSGGQLEQELSFLSGIRSGFSNDGTALIFSGGQYDIANNQYTHEGDDGSSDSILNSHRRSRSQNVGSKLSKSERKGGRMLLMKNRLAGSNNQQNDIIRSGVYQSTKNGSIQRETTPLKSLNQTNKSLGKTQNSNILNSEERKKLFNTFMKEMNQSIVQQSQGSNTKNKKKNTQVNESMQQMRQGISNPQSRPRSQLAVNNQAQSQNVNNYSSLVNNPQGSNVQAQLKYKFVNAASGANGSRNTQINKIKDFFIHNTYNASLGNSGAGGNLVQQIMGINSQLSMQHNPRHSIKKQGGGAGAQDSYQFSPMRKKQHQQ